MNLVEMLHTETNSDDREEARLLLGKVFEQEVKAYFDHQAWDCFAEEYLHSTPEVQGIINCTLISICGRSLPTLIKLAELGDDVVLEEGRALINADKADKADDIDWDEHLCPYTPPHAVTAVTVDPNHFSVILHKALRDFATADAEGKKAIGETINEMISTKIKDDLGPNWKLVGVGNSNETQTERMAKLRRERKRARFSVVSSDDRKE
jgi:hypothetical protein